MSKGYGVTNKVIMIGIDGMDPLYTQGLLSQGKLPNIKKFIERGTTTKDGSATRIYPSVLVFVGYWRLAWHTRDYRFLEP